MDDTLCAAKLHSPMFMGAPLLAVEAYFHELKCDRELASCAIVLAAGLLQDTVYPTIVTDNFGERAAGKLTDSERKAAAAAIKTLHAAKAAHGDIQWANLLFNDQGDCRLEDVPSRKLNASHEEQLKDLAALKYL